MFLFILGFDFHFSGCVSSSCSEASMYDLFMSDSAQLGPCAFYFEKGTTRKLSSHDL